jgi:hypothetical protein
VDAIVGNDVIGFTEGFLVGLEDTFGVGTPVVSFDGLYVGFCDGTNEQYVGAVAELFTPYTITVVDGKALGPK